MSDMFEPLNAQEKAQRKHGKPVKDEGIAIVPVPDDVIRETQEHHQLGKPSCFWEYKDDKGKTLYFVCRFIDKDDNKEDRPLSYRKYKSGKLRWAWKALDAPRPLYGLDRLATRSNAPVIVCEGEKAADAAADLFSDHVAVTSPNGAGSPHLADWTPLLGRNVTIWPDHDDDGRTYAQSVARLAKQAGAESVRIVTVPDDFRDKWDLADEPPEGRTQGDLESLLNEAQPVIDPLENLIERVKNDPGAAYMPDVLDAIMALQRENLPSFITLRAQLKKAGVGVTFLDSTLGKRSMEQG